MDLKYWHQQNKINISLTELLDEIDFAIKSLNDPSDNSQQPRD